MAIWNIGEKLEIKNDKKTSIRILLPSGLLFLFMLGYVRPKAEMNNYLAREIQGIVTKKYIDTTRSNFPTLEFTNRTGDRTREVFVRYHRYFFEAANIGDSILKLKGEKQIQLLRNGIMTP